MANTKKNVVEINPDVNSQIENLRKDIASLATALKKQAETTVETKTAQVLDTANSAAADTKAKYNQLTTNAEKSIRENPLTSVVIAVGAGMLLGLISRR